MFCKDIIESDDFTELPNDAKCLYFYLCMGSDDDGFCDRPRDAMRKCGATNDAMKLLIAKKFLLVFDGKPNVIVIKHWKINNYIRGDRHHATKYMELLRELYFDENDSYSQNPNDGHRPCLPSGNQVSTNCLPTGNQAEDNRLTQYNVMECNVSECNDNDKNNGNITEEGCGEEPEAPEETAQQETGDDRCMFFKKQILRELERGDTSHLVSFYVRMAKAEGIDIQIFDNGSPDPLTRKHTVIVKRMVPE